MLLELIASLTIANVPVYQAPVSPDRTQTAPASATTLDEVLVTGRPDEVICVDGERRLGSRISRPAVCRMRAEWTAVRIERATNEGYLRAYLGRYSMDSSLTDEAAYGRTANEVRRTQAIATASR